MNSKLYFAVTIAELIFKIALFAWIIWAIWFGIRAVIDYAKRPVPVTVEQRR